MQGFNQYSAEITLFKYWRSLVLFLIIAFAVACIGNLIAEPSLVDWYADLEKPAFTPPGWVFGIAWSFLYASMSLSIWRIWVKRHKAIIFPVMLLYHTQLALNLLWSVAFFGLHNPLVALADIVLLQLANITTAVCSFKIDRISGLLFVPYILWVSFVSVLNIYIWIAN